MLPIVVITAFTCAGIESSAASYQISGQFTAASAEHLAELLHHYHQSLAPDFEKQAEAEAQSWKRVSQEERNRMIAAAKLALLELDQLDKERENSKRYFAKPGEAEWGC